MSITYLEAIREAQARALASDPRVFIYGQDVGPFGGAFKATKNLARDFPGRVLDAPISKDAILGSAVGAAIGGMRPIIEIQFSDFSAVGFSRSSTKPPPCSGAPRFLARSLFVCLRGAPRAAGHSTANAWKPSTPITRDW